MTAYNRSPSNRSQRESQKALSSRLARSPGAAAPVQTRRSQTALQRATALSPENLRPADVIALQRTLGNRAVGSLLEGRPSAAAKLAPRLAFQAKMTVGPAGDTYE